MAVRAEWVHKMRVSPHQFGTITDMGMSISAKTGEVTYDRPASITPATSWTHRSGDTEAKREHDFNNWLMELTLAAESGDSKVVAFVTDELRTMYRTANRKEE